MEILLKNNDDITISNFTYSFSLFREEDTSIFEKMLNLHYDLFKLFHNTITEHFLENPEKLKQILNDFTISFNRHFFHTGWGRTYFNNWMFRGYSICPLDSKMYLYSIKHVNAIKTQFDSIQRIWVFYKDYYLYSDLPQESVEILHTYLIGAANEKRDGYVPNWMDDSEDEQNGRITTIRVPRKSASKNTSIQEIQAEDFKPEYLNGDAVHIYSDFWKSNKLGFRGELENKQGFIVGPSVFRKTDKSNLEEMRTYELFSPTIYLKDSLDDDTRRPYKLIVVKFN